jgi:DNA-binding transcriptional MerR regulator
MIFPMPFKKKKEEPEKIYIPVDMVLSYASQGLSEAEIISKLQAQGFAPEYIDRALRMALKERVTTSVEEPSETMETTPTLSAPPMVGLQMPTEPVTRHPTPLGFPPERVVSPLGPRSVSLEQAATEFTFEPKEVRTPEAPIEEVTIEELIEGIVAERWQEFEERLTDFEKRDFQLQAQIEDVRKRIKEFEDSLKTKETGLTGKLEEFGGSMENIEGRIGSIEKVFKEFLPDLTENIKTMSDLVEKIKEEKK